MPARRAGEGTRGNQLKAGSSCALRILMQATRPRKSTDQVPARQHRQRAQVAASVRHRSAGERESGRARAGPRGYVNMMRCTARRSQALRQSMYVFASFVSYFTVSEYQCSSS